MEKWTQFNRVRLWHVAFFCAALFAAGMFIPTLTTAQSSSKEDTYRQLGLFGDIFQRVRESYVDDIDDRELIEAAITGMLTRLIRILPSSIPRISQMQEDQRPFRWPWCRDHDGTGHGEGCLAD